MSRPTVTDQTVAGLLFARACVLDQREASHARGDSTWDERYEAALDAIYEIVQWHEKSQARGSR